MCLQFGVSCFSWIAHLATNQAVGGSLSTKDVPRPPLLKEVSNQPTRVGFLYLKFGVSYFSRIEYQATHQVPGGSLSTKDVPRPPLLKEVSNQPTKVGFFVSEIWCELLQLDRVPGYAPGGRRFTLHKRRPASATSFKWLNKKNRIQEVGGSLSIKHVPVRHFFLDSGKVSN
ncbi:hypothetical protein C3B51_09910 [Pseudoalteromonas rubra]|uniref:Uncharacterized protein n=1 Tax=Pseudoalteromonas rubra TaxID=43658 RepID=A0A4Q7ECM8_9GAMM|nr:hypothetical protein C3B51_09910 [Pseudoalteromonas rubra]